MPVMTAGHRVTNSSLLLARHQPSQGVEHRELCSPYCPDVSIVPSQTCSYAPRSVWTLGLGCLPAGQVCGALPKRGAPGRCGFSRENGGVYPPSSQCLPSARRKASRETHCLLIVQKILPENFCLQLLNSLVVPGVGAEPLQSCAFCMEPAGTSPAVWGHSRLCAENLSQRGRVRQGRGSL